METVHEAIGSVANTIGMRQVARFLYDIDDQQISALMQDNAEKTLDALIAQGIDPKVAKALLTNPEFYNTVGSILTNGKLVETGEGLGGNSEQHSQTGEELNLLVTLERTSFQKVLLGFDEAQDFVADLPAEQAEAAMLAMSLLTGGVVKTVIDIAKDAVVDTAIGDEIREFQHDVAKEIASSANHLDTKSHEFLLDYEKGEGFSTSLQEGAEFGLAVVGIGVGLGVAGKTGLGDNDKPDLVHSGKQEVDGQGGVVRGQLGTDFEFGSLPYGTTITNKIEFDSYVIDNDVVFKDGWDSTRVYDEILLKPNGSRPEPSSYLSQQQIDAHLSKFNEGAVRFTSRSATKKYGSLGPDGGFVLPKSEFDRVLSESKGDLRIVEKKLGLDMGYLGDSDTMAVFIKPEEMKNIRMPSGNEGGANGQWVPGGYTSGGVPEAVMDFSHKPPVEEINLK
ncbi:hypothetical protein IFO68_12135 [Photobacterium sp. CAU 1568]|uniref:DUF4237 domain-containing protein n=1 Tax=Photobacterium arenosum TaxID=2774143 RepID=A0ABR9BLJ1_9GAMM|nr:hypothetical protein [Photobacterium arenosum]MBD8513419.1 hypothetical protein [Photobacterium arenosum]